MAFPFAHEDLEKLKKFINFASENPTLLNLPQLEFVKEFIEKFGGKIPTGGKCPFGGAGKFESKVNESDHEQSENVDLNVESEESEIELDMEGVIDGDIDSNQAMGDSNKTPTETEIDEASEIRAEAAAAYSDKDFEKAINLYTKAIELNPGNALFYAKRGQACLKLKKPNACIQNCDKALELNCDSAAAYKFRGRAHRLLGNWEAAAKDLRQACKLDFDEEADEWLREVTPNAKKIEQHHIKQERKKVEKQRKAQEAQRQAHANQAKQQRANASGGFPGTSGESGLNINDLLAGMQDPEIAAALQDIAKNPANIEKYKSNPKIAKLIDMAKMMSDKNLGGFPGGFPGGFSGAFPNDFSGGHPASFNASDSESRENASKETSQDSKTSSKKPDFVDDGLD